MDEKAEDAAAPISSSASPTDDESLTTNSESEAFETWTLVMDKDKKRVETADAFKKLSSGIEVLEKKKTTTETAAAAANSTDIRGDKPNETYPVKDTPPNDDFSDGISVISESESGGRISPHLFQQEHTINTGMADQPPSNGPSGACPTHGHGHSQHTNFEQATNNTKLRQRCRNTTNSTNTRSLQTIDVTGEVREDTRVHHIVRHGVTGMFYVGIALALLSFMGRLRAPEWEQLAAEKAIDELDLKLSAMELQNNLMRAEIDILARQVKYLSDINDNTINNNGNERPTMSPPPVPKQQRRNEKTFKAWPGNDDTMKPVDISKGDLKRPFKCADGKFVEVAAMCLQKAKDGTLSEQVQNIVNKFLNDDDTEEHVHIRNGDDVPMEILMFESVISNDENDDDDDDDDDMESIQFEPNSYEGAISHDKEPIYHHSNVKEPSYQSKEVKHDRREEKFFKMDGKDHSKEKYNGYNSKERARNVKKQQQQYAKLMHDHLRADDDKDNSDERDSKERFNKKNYNSKERYNTNNNNNNKKREKKRQFDNSKENFNSNEKYRKSGQWQEKLMRQRENARRQHENERNGNNWFIERADGREQMRTD